jgi:hypothetical protein
VKLLALATLAKLILGGTVTVSASVALTLPLPSAPVLVFNKPAGGCALAMLLTVVCAIKGDTGRSRPKSKANKPRKLEGLRLANCCDNRESFINDLVQARMACALFLTRTGAPEFILLCADFKVWVQKSMRNLSHGCMKCRLNSQKDG